MTFLLILSGSILLFYMAIILVASYKLEKPDLIVIKDRVFSKNTYSIIVPFRNEKENLKYIYSDLLDLRFDQKRFEVIFIDDNSTDGSFELLDNFEMPDNFNLLTSLKAGKKQALIKAISFSAGNFIATTDADCRIHPLWLNSIDKTIHLKDPKLLVQPVITKYHKKLISQFQYYDSLSLLGINMVVYNIKEYPSLASGANLIFQKKAFNNIEPFKDNVHISSGDDMFLLKSFIKNDPNSITLNYSFENLVVTKSEDSWIKLIKQRSRWVGKMKQFNNTSAFALGLLSFIVQLILIEILILGLWYQNYFIILFVIIWLIKSFIDYLFFIKIAQQVAQKVRWLNVFILEPLYMIFVPLIILLSMFINPKWKGRKIID